MKRACFVAAALLFATAAPAAAPWEGRWRLVSQTYGAGDSNLAPDDAPVRLELTEVGGAPSGTLSAGGRDDGARPWPAFVREGGTLPVQVVSRRAGPSRDVEAVYRVRPVPTEDLVLEIRERYVLSADGATLEGTVEVKFGGGTANRGGYTLHRRFARER